MTDDLRQKAKTYRQFGDLRAAENFDRAADYIEKLGAVNDELFSNTLQLYARIETLEAALRSIADVTEKWEHDLISQVNEIARTALEGKND